MEAFPIPQRRGSSQACHCILDTCLSLMASPTQFAYFQGRLTLSLCSGAILGFFYWLKDRNSDIPERNLSDRQIEIREPVSSISAVGYTSVPIYNLQECLEYVTYGAYRRDDLNNRRKERNDINGETFINHEKKAEARPDKDWLKLGEFPEIVGGVLLVTALYTLPLLYLVETPLLVAFMLNVPYMLGTEPYGGNHNFTYRLFRE